MNKLFKVVCIYKKSVYIYKSKNNGRWCPPNLKQVKMQDLNLTQLEEKILTSLIDNLYAEEGFSDVDANDLSKWTNTDIKITRGVLASLVKKGIIWISEANNGGFKIVYLEEAHYNLHPEWKNYIQ